MHRTISSAFPIDILAGAGAALAVCVAGVWSARWFYAPLAVTALLAAAWLAVTWLRRRMWTHDAPTLVAGLCVAGAFVMAFAVLSEVFAEAEHVRGYERVQTPAALFDAHPPPPWWRRGALPFFRPRVPSSRPVPGLAHPQ